MYFWPRNFHEKAREIKDCLWNTNGRLVIQREQQIAFVYRTATSTLHRRAIFPAYSFARYIIANHGTPKYRSEAQKIKDRAYIHSLYILFDYRVSIHLKCALCPHMLYYAALNIAGGVLIWLVQFINAACVKEISR